MSHIITNIERRDGIDSLVTTGTFRGVTNGTTMPSPFTLREGLTLVRDFTLSKRPVYVPTNALYSLPRDERAGAPVATAVQMVPGLRSVTRDDTGASLGIVNRTYPVVGNKRTLARLLGAELSDDTGAIVRERDDQRLSALAILGNGEQAYATVQLHEPRRAGRAGVIARHRFIHWGHDGRTSITDRLIQHDIVCQNTLAMAHAGGTERRTARHTKSTAHVEARLVDIGEQMRALLGLADEQDAAFDAMARTGVTDQQAAGVLALLYGKRNADGRYDLSRQATEHANDILRLLNEADGRDSVTGLPTGVTREHTAWDLLAAGTFHLDHVAPPARDADGLDAGEAYTGPVDDMLRREATDSLTDYRTRLTGILTDVANGADVLALAGAR